MERKLLLALLAVFVVVTTTLGAIDTDYVLYKETQVPIPLTYTPESTITYLGKDAGYFSAPEDLFIDDEDILYVADTGNDRIVRLTGQGIVLGVYYGDAESP